MRTLDTFDWITISAYFVVLLGIAVWVIRKKKESTEDYFLAGRNVGWFVVGASIFASNIGSEHVVGLAGAGAGNRLPMGGAHLGMGIFAFLCTGRCLHYARILGEAF